MEKNMGPLQVGLIYLMFFLSGAAALIYQVVWVRSLSLVFGGSHLAVTVVLSIFMAGLAIGGYVFGKRADAVTKPLRLYGILELGIALFALLFFWLMNIYPSIYIPLAQGKDDAPLYLTVIRTVFSVVALIGPTILMGGTLPVLTRFITRHPKALREHLSWLYGFNTLGAVFGATAAGFFLLRLYSASTTLFIAVVTNAGIGLISILLQGRLAAVPTPGISGSFGQAGSPLAGTTRQAGTSDLLPSKLVLWGIGVSGLCALGYEILWTRILTIVVGASAYGFTIMLVAFLTGIALGSEAYGLFPRIFKVPDKGVGRAITWFGVVQMIIGVTALLVTLYIRDLPATVAGLQNFMQRFIPEFFPAKVWTNFLLAFVYMVVPAFFMGLSFPLAGRIHAEYKDRIGSAVGEVLAYNTAGAILGAALSGFVMIYLFGIERSLQMLIAVNVGYGSIVVFSAMNSRRATVALSVLTAAALLFLALDRQSLRIWDMKYFAIYRNNAPEAFRTREMIRDAVENTDVLYFAEGVESIVSSIKTKGGEQSFITNGRVEASSHLQDQQCQFTLGHLPMLLNKDPKRVLVVGTGSGMTLGATSAHPGVEQITLAEIEPKVLGVARTFEEYNNKVLDNPKLRVVFNDGRNFLLTTKEKFDVITADPIHPWFRGAGYLYTSEYFKLVAEHLRPGGMVCQWLPIYELTPENVKSIVKTFQQLFPHTMLWLTHKDAEIVGSNAPIVLDEADLERRIAEPAIAKDLKRVMMGSATDFLSYFVMGTEGMRQFGTGAIINTDDNLYLEFSAPYSIGNFRVMGENVAEIIQHREGILTYLAPAQGAAARTEQERKWRKYTAAVGVQGPALALFLAGRQETGEFKQYLDTLNATYPWFAPGRFLKNEYLTLAAQKPTLLESAAFPLLNEQGREVRLVISAVLVPISTERASVVFVDNDRKVVYGEVDLSLAGPERRSRMQGLVNDMMAGIQAVYQQELGRARAAARPLPPAGPTMQRIRDVITLKVRTFEESSS
jgi:spermidine synthase